MDKGKWRSPLAEDLYNSYIREIELRKTHISNQLRLVHKKPGIEFAMKVTEAIENDVHIQYLVNQCVEIRHKFWIPDKE